MGAAMPAALNEGEMLVFTGIIDASGGVRPNTFGQEVRVVRNLHLLDFFAADVEHRVVAFGELPLEGSLVAIDVEALGVLPGGVEEKAGDFESEVLVADLEMGRFEGKR